MHSDRHAREVSNCQVVEDDFTHVTRRKGYRIELSSCGLNNKQCFWSKLKPFFLRRMLSSLDRKFWMRLECRTLSSFTSDQYNKPTLHSSANVYRENKQEVTVCVFEAGTFYFFLSPRLNIACFKGFFLTSCTVYRSEISTDDTLHFQSSLI